jgi:hypothetical protein
MEDLVTPPSPPLVGPQPDIGAIVQLQNTIAASSTALGEQFSRFGTARLAEMNERITEGLGRLTNSVNELRSSGRAT